ncbi:MAG: prepilin-type N-terminal cleavage/methylation domain-containing protein [Sedimentisphaerales bacterium]|nr:prepilin-type N-terminal cleavage/methylation domain-containing protein [Sedimentisphaerales bacterium]
MYRRTSQANAFTLVELLVVISIIALLLAMLMPALNKAKMQAQAVVCGSDIKQIALGNLVYQQDNRGWICSPWNFQFGINNPQYNSASATLAAKTGGWEFRWSQYSVWVGAKIDGEFVKNHRGDPAWLQEKVFKQGWLYPYIKSSKVFLCPGAPRKKPASTGYVYEVFGFAPYWSYTCNGTPGMSLYVLSQGAMNNHPQADLGGWRWDFSVQSDMVKPGPARVFLYMEQNRNLSSNRSQWDNSAFDNTVELSNTYVPGGDSLSDMHNGGGNMTFYDGHVEYMKRTAYVRTLLDPAGAASFAGNRYYP